MGFFTGEGDTRRFYEADQWFSQWLTASPASATYLGQQVAKATGHTLQFTAAELRPVVDWAVRHLGQDRSAVRPDWAYRSPLGDTLTMHGAALVDGILVYLGGLADQHTPQAWALDKDEDSATYLDPTLGVHGPPVAAVPGILAALAEGRPVWDEFEHVLRWFDSPGTLSYAAFDTPRDVREALMPKARFLRKAPDRPEELPAVPPSQALRTVGEEDPGLMVRDLGTGHAPGTPSDATHHALVMLGAGAIDEAALLRFVRACDAAPGVSRVAFRSHHLLEVWAPGLLCAEVLGELRRAARTELPQRPEDGELSDDDRRALLLRAPFLERLGQAEDLAVAVVEVDGFDAAVTVQTPWLDDYTYSVVLAPRLLELLTPALMEQVADRIGGLEGIDRVLWEDAEAIHVHGAGLEAQALAEVVAEALR